MRQVFIDEAGTSADQPVRIVVGIIVDEGRPLQRVEEELEAIKDRHVPSAYREGFIFHALDVLHGSSSSMREAWPLEARLALFKDVLCLLRQHRLPICLGVVHKGWCERFLPKSSQALLRKKKISHPKFEHGLALQCCVERVDHFLRNYLEDQARAVLIAEDVSKPELLSWIAMWWQKSPKQFDSSHLRQNASHSVLGLAPDPVKFEIKRIDQGPRFLKKAAAPLLQLADACAFTFRRSLEGRVGAAELIEAMLGKLDGEIFTRDPVWKELHSHGLFNVESFRPLQDQMEAYAIKALTLAELRSRQGAVAAPDNPSAAG